MIYNDELLFLHVPKTAGKSLALALTQTIRRPVHCHVPVGTERMLRDALDLEDVVIERSNGHENLRKASRVLATRGRSVDGFAMVMVTVRNPYDLMVSNYHFMRATYAENLDRSNFQLAHESDFETFVAKVQFLPIERWLTLEGRRPQNLRVLRFESLQSDFAAAMSELGYPSPELPILNATEHSHFSDYLTPRAEAAIYQTFRYLFDQGVYERMRAN